MPAVKISRMPRSRTDSVDFEMLSFRTETSVAFFDIFIQKTIRQRECIMKSCLFRLMLLPMFILLLYVVLVMPQQWTIMAFLSEGPELPVAVIAGLSFWVFCHIVA